MRLSENFSEWEFKCKCGNCELVKPPQELLDVLEDLRSHFDKPITIMSGYRCETHNKNVGGALRSKHKLGIAADIQIKDISPNKVHEYLINKYPNTYGIGGYPYFTHIDVRSKKARW